MRPATAAGLLLLLTGPAAAQGYGLPGYPMQGGLGMQPPGGFAPNYYNRQTQPLSPYLNLLNRGNLPGVNYFYGVRPGLPSGGGVNQFGQVPQYTTPVGPSAGGFLPQANIPYDPNLPEFATGGQPVQLRSAGHPAVYGNQFAGHGGYQSVYFGAVNRGGFLPGGGMPGQRPALGGLGAGQRTGGNQQPRTR